MLMVSSAVRLGGTAEDHRRCGLSARSIELPWRTKGRPEGRP